MGSAWAGTLRTLRSCSITWHCSCCHDSIAWGPSAFLLFRILLPGCWAPWDCRKGPHRWMLVILFSTAILGFCVLWGYYCLLIVFWSFPRAISIGIQWFVQCFSFQFCEENNHCYYSSASLLNHSDMFSVLVFQLSRLILDILISSVRKYTCSFTFIIF